MPDARPWWMDAVVYQIYPRSLRDTSGDGVGDLGGVRRQLDHLAWLGVDALWLSPIFPSPMADHGYDVADYCDVDPLFGTLDELDRLVAEAHERGLKVLLDWVPNHSSDAHPWFVAARSSRDDPHRDWYVWVDGSPDRPPNDWRAAFPPGPAWTWDEGTGAWYYHRYTPRQPDLNWNNPEVEAAMHDTLRFWLDRGVDGFRMDVVHQIGKDMSLVGTDADGPDDPERNHELVRGIRSVIDAYSSAGAGVGASQAGGSPGAGASQAGDGDRVAVGEAYILDVAQVARYVDPAARELHLSFNFLPLWFPWTAAEWRKHLDEVLRVYGDLGAWPTWVLGSHDIPRVRTRLGRDDAARSAAVLLLTLRGTAFLYAGDELGLQDAVVPPELVQDPAAFRDGCRAPIPWEPGPDHGWAGATPWLPWPPEADERNAAVLCDDPASILHLVRRTLAVRKASPALREGAMALRPEGSGAGAADVVAWERTAGDDRRVVAVSFVPEPRGWDAPAAPDAPDGPDGRGWVVEVSSADAEREGGAFDGLLAPHEAVVLRPG